MRMPRQRVKRIRLLVWNRFVKFGMLIAVFLVLVTYLGWQVQSIVSPPEIVLFSPADQSITQEAILIVEGLVEDESTVFVDSEQVVVNDDRTFKTTIDLEKGLNIIVVEAEARYSKRARIERTVLFDPDALVQ
jgi:hypothetical protein